MNSLQNHKPFIRHRNNKNHSTGTFQCHGYLVNSKAYNKKIVEHALSVGGTCTGEHGVGVGKMSYQQQEHGNALAVMKAIKLALDPKNILNPNKLLS